MDRHILAEPDPDPDLDPGSQNLADPTDLDPDPKHCLYLTREILIVLT